MNIQSVGIVVKRKDEKSQFIADKIEEWLTAHGVKTLYQDTEHNFALFAGVDLVLSVGGDGSMIRTARRMAGTDIPLVGVNTGRVGFLPEIDNENWQACLEKAIVRDFEIEKRMALEVVVTRDGSEVFNSIAVNDLAITRGGIARLLAFDVFIDEAKLCYLRADGIIVSSPTGATAYSSSAGGPLIYPTMNAYSLSAICPFLTNIPPMLFNQHMVLGVKICEAGSKTYATIDGQEVFKLYPGDTIRIYGISDCITFARFGMFDYLSKLRAAGLVSDSPRSSGDKCGI